MEELQIEAFLSAYPRMRLRPSQEDVLCVQGNFYLDADMENLPRIQKEFEIKVAISKTSTGNDIKVYELGNEIPKSFDYHIENDRSLCLGSPLKKLLLLDGNRSLSHFMRVCVEPFLYSAAHKLDHGFYPYGDLDHEHDGLVQDYQDMFGVIGLEGVYQLLACLKMRKRTANKLPCPCKCGRRLGVCEFRLKLTKIRGLAKRKWFHKQYSSLTKSIIALHETRLSERKKKKRSK